MSDETPKIRFVIDEVRLRGLSQRDGRRLMDAVETELRRLAPEIARAANLAGGDRLAQKADGGAIRAARRIEANAAPVAQAIVKAIKP